MPAAITSEDRPFLAAIIADLNDDRPKLIYADWLEERGDPRGAFLRQYVKAAGTMQASDLPSTAGLSEEWVDLTGFSLLAEIVNRGYASLKEPVLRVARPALRMVHDTPRIEDGDGEPDAEEFEDDEESAFDTLVTTDETPLGASKLFGLPDLPAGFEWPIGEQCRAIYNDSCEGIESLAGFLAQVNLAEIDHTEAGKMLPKTGLLSFFCYQDWESDNPDAIGALCLYFPDTSDLVRVAPPEELTDGNECLDAHRLYFMEFLDIPYDTSGPWSAELKDAGGNSYSEMYFDRFQHPNMENMLGYARATSGDDPTPSKTSRHLILLRNKSGCTLHIQIPEQELAKQNFGAITLNWVDFD